MKTKHIQLIIFKMLLLVVIVTGCKAKEWVESRGNGPTMTVSSEFEDIDGINVGDQVTIPVNIKSPEGIKRFSYYFITQTANGTQSGTPVHLDRTDFPAELSEQINFTIVPSLLELVLVSFDKNNNSSELHIKLSDIRELPVILFKGGTDSIPTYFENKRMLVEGNVTSKYDLSSITYRTIENGTVSAETPMSFTNKTNTPFAANIMVRKGLTAVIITAKNIHNGAAVDTFKIGTVTDDAISIALAGNATEIPMIYADSTNTINATVVSGSDVTSLTYAIRTNGVYGPEQTITLGKPLDNFSFPITFRGAAGMDAIRITGSNEGGLTQTSVFNIVKVNQKLLRFSVTLTSEIGPGKNNWFAAWKPPHVFDVAGAAANAQWIDFGLIRHGTGFRIVTPSLYNVAGYDVSIAPYMQGFNTATYTLVTAFRRSVTAAALDTLIWGSNMDNFMEVNIKGPGPIGENYNITTTYRRLSDNIVTTSVNRGFIIGWGTRTGESARHEAYGAVLIKSVSIAGTVATLTLDIVAPAENMRARYNDVSSLPYP